MDVLSTDTFKIPIISLFLFGIMLQLYRLYRVRACHEPGYVWSRLWNVSKIKNIDNFVKVYTQFSVCQIIVFLAAIIIIQLVKLEHAKIYLLILALLSAPIAIMFHYKFKNT